MILALCLVASVTDADTIVCADKTRVRIAGINAREKDGTCNAGAPCPAMGPRQATQVVTRLTLGKRLSCRQVGTSYRRAVMDCRLPNGAGLSCAIIATGAAAAWPRYWRQYRMRPCG